MKPGILIMLLFLPGSQSSATDKDFLDYQLQFERVHKAQSTKLSVLEKSFQSAGLEFPPKEMFIRIFKKEETVELWARSTETGSFCFIKSWPFCKNSGKLGPKRREGDLQIPEGFYHIVNFNPTSKFYLSLRINYPNASDKILGDPEKPGGDIYIHGGCQTKGCIPIWDDEIQELYLTAVYAKSQGQEKIPVHIFPIHFNDTHMRVFEKISDKKDVKFWKNLEKGYKYFEKHRKLPEISVNLNTGEYIIQ